MRGRIFISTNADIQLWFFKKKQEMKTILGVYNRFLIQKVIDLSFLAVSHCIS